MKKILILMVSLMGFAQLSSSEIIAKLTKYKKEIGLATGAVATGVALYKAHQQYVQYVKDQINKEKLDEIHLLNSRITSLELNNGAFHLNLSRLRSDLQKQKEDNVKLYNEKTALFEQLSSLNNKNNELDTKNDVLEVTINNSRIKLLKEKIILLLKNAILTKKIAKLSNNNSFQQVYPQPASTLNYSDESKEDYENHQEIHNSSTTSSLASSQNFEFVDIEHSIREIQEFIDHIIRLKKDSGNNLAWYHYLLDNYKTIKSKILNIKSQLVATDDESSKITLHKVIVFDLKMTELEDDAPWGKGKLVMNKLVTKGKEYIDEIKTNNIEHLKGIVNLVWYFYSLAAKKGQDFEQGTFGIKDYKDVICEFLCKCEIAYSRTNFEAYGIKAPIVMTSHYYEHKDKMEQFGIDIPREYRNSLILPKGMTHILFGLIPEGNLFLKPEDYGIGNPMDLIDHSVDYAMSKIRKIDGIGNGDEQKGMRKERVPKNVLNAWQKLFDNYFGESNTVDTIEFYKAGKTYGISHMLYIINNSKEFNIENETYKQKREKLGFKLFLKQIYDNLDSRTGNEVVLTNEDFGF